MLTETRCPRAGAPDGSHPNENMNTKPKRILVVDDEPSLTRVVKFNLEQHGEYEVQEVNVST
jgi:PleD family two-component response regulator